MTHSLIPASQYHSFVKEYHKNNNNMRYGQAFVNKFWDIVKDHPKDINTIIFYEPNNLLADTMIWDMIDWNS